MRSPAAAPLLTLLLAPLLVLASACGDGSGADGAKGADSIVVTPGPLARSTPPSPPGTDPDAGAREAPAPGTTACDEVVAGIDAFNLGDYAETVAHFEDAVPLAEAEARTDPSRRADALLEAVRYYAALAPDDYLEASASSPEFARFKAITLGQCASGEPAQDPGGGPGGGGISA